MLVGRLTDSQGHDGDPILADELSKDEYRKLTDAGRVRCPDCDARLIHVSGINDSDDLPDRFRAQAIPANGNIQLRVPHWRSHAIEDHAPDCEYRNDPHMAEHVVSFKQALLDGRPIRVNINFSIGFGGLAARFNTAVSDPRSGLWHKDAWMSQHPNALSVPARDITDILHYLQVAKQLKGKEGLHQLFFNNQEAVQSCARFVVAGEPARIQNVVNAIYKRWRDSRTQNQFYGDTPRLFLFEATPRQQELARSVTDSDLWGQKMTIHAPIEYQVKLGLDSHVYTVTNQTMLDKGPRLWVVATPKMTANQLKDVQRRIEGQPHGLHGKPLFLTLTIDTRSAMGVVGSERLTRGQARDANPSRQLHLFADRPRKGHRRGARGQHLSAK